MKEVSPVGRTHREAVSKRMEKPAYQKAKQRDRLKRVLLAEFDRLSHLCYKEKFFDLGDQLLQLKDQVQLFIEDTSRNNGAEHG